MFSALKTHPVLKIASSSVINLPSPSSISYWWNFGSLLGLCLSVQLVTGLFLAMHYASDVSVAFESVNHITRDVNSGWLLRAFHANGASAFFICLYAHIGRGVYYASFYNHMTWSVGVLLLLSVMAAAFLGYVLPWGQMSFWGATVITNLFSAIPYMGGDIVTWLWGGFAVDNATLTRFFAFHFLVPFLVVGLVGIHLLFLHHSGSNNPLGLFPNNDKLPFHPYFTLKDLMGFLIISWALLSLVLWAPWLLGDPENFIPANPLVTPAHIQPEWYFLFAYAILRAIPNKLGGVVALAASVMILFIMALYPSNKFYSSFLYPVNKTMVWWLVSVLILLTWIGACPVEAPYVATGQTLSILYFAFYFLYPSFTFLWDIVTN